MFARTSLFAIVLATAVGCGGGGDDPESGGNGANGAAGKAGGASKGTGKGSGGSAAKPAFDLVAVEPFPKIDVEVTKHPQVKTAAEFREVVAAMKKELESTSVPGVLQYPFSRDAAIGYARTMKFIQAQRKANLAWLKAVDVKTIEVEFPVDTQNLANVRRQEIERLEMYLPRDIDHSLKYSRENLAGSIDSHVADMERGAKLSLDDDAHVVNQLADPKAVERRAGVTRAASTMIATGKALDAALGLEGVDWDAKHEALKSHATKFFGMVEKAADRIKPPKDIGKPEFAKIAAEVLAKKDFAYERLIVNLDKRTESETSYHFDDGTIHKVVRRWDEFQVATIEKEDGGKYGLWYNEMLYYHEGPRTVPKGKWVLGARFRSSSILEKNIGE